MIDNIIQFPDPDKYKGEDRGEVMARITVYEDSAVGCWVSNEVETHDQKTWLKACLNDGIYGIHSIIHSDSEDAIIIEGELE